MTWQNLISFLCATSGCCSLTSVSTTTILGHIVGQGILPRVYDDDADIDHSLIDFVWQCVELLVSQSIIVRETVKEALGNELPLQHLGLLVEQMGK